MFAGTRRTLSVLITLAFTGAAEQNCGEQELTKCARPLQVLSDTSDLKFASRKEELDLLCPDLMKGLQCIHSYTRRCMTSEHRTHFKKLFRGTGQAVHELCNEGEYQSEFLSHAACLQGLRPQHERCAADHHAAVAALSANNSVGDPVAIKTVCCSFHAYISCSERVVREKCGSQSADFTRQFLNRISDSLIKMHCTEYIESQCSDSMFYHGSSSGLAPALAALLFPVVLTMAVLLATPASTWATGN